MACGCSAGAGVEMWVNVKADGTPTKAMTKSEAMASQQVFGGYLRKA